MNQRKYALKVISDLRLGTAKPLLKPLEANTKLTTQHLDKLMQTTDDDMLEDKTQYHRLISKMLYLTLTRPDITF